VRKVRCCGRYSVRAMTIILQKRKRKESAYAQGYQCCSREMAALERHAAKGKRGWRFLETRSASSLTEDEFLRGGHHV
jgi:hypothetical protein